MASRKSKNKHRHRSDPEPRDRRPADTASPRAKHADATAGGFEVMIETKPPGLIRRFLTTQRHFIALSFGGAVALAREYRRQGRVDLRTWPIRAIALLGRPFLDKRLRDLPFPVQLRRRLEILGPTYIKLGQVLSLREDLLPRIITDELKNLLDRLPVVPFERFRELVAEGLEADPDALFAWIDPEPLGSASIAQTHRARTHAGDEVILKVVKPGIRTILERDAILLKILGGYLQILIPRFQPRRVIREFCEYTLKEVDLRREADNAETFTSNFRDLAGVRFPVIYRKMSGESVLCMEFFDGFKPSSPQAERLTQEERDQLVDFGSEAIIRMLFKDGFFHADLHPGNLMILDGPRVGFIDLGMVGRFDEELRRSLMYYYYCLVTGDSENAARYLAMIAQPGPGGDSHGFRRAAEEVCRRWSRSANFRDFSLGQLILRSVSAGISYRMYFPVEMVLMVKALVTFESVGQMLNPGFDVAVVSQRHVNALFLQQFNPLRLVRDSLRGAPEMVDAMVKTPLLITEGLRMLEQATHRPQENPFSGLRGTLLAGFCLVAGAILAAFKSPWPIWATFFALALVLTVRRR